VIADGGRAEDLELRTYDEPAAPRPVGHMYEARATA
jgi:hypothetical protein